MAEADKGIYRQVEPPEHLVPFVRRFMVADCEGPISLDVPARPTGYQYLGWFPKGQAWAFVNGVETFNSETSRFHLSGQIQSADIMLSYRGTCQHLLAEFTALGAYQLLGVAGQESFEKCVAADSLKLSFAAEMEAFEAANTGPDLSARLAAFSEYLLARAQSPQPVPEYLTQGIREIEGKNGALRLADLYEELDVSGRQFTREFSRIVGLSPKTFARIVQINTAIGLLMTNDQEGLADIALQAGFGDQQHFHKVFREVVLSTPTAFINSDEEMLFSFLARQKQPD